MMMCSVMWRLLCRSMTHGYLVQFYLLLLYLLQVLCFFLVKAPVGRRPRRPSSGTFRPVNCPFFLAFPFDIERGTQHPDNTIEQFAKLSKTGSASVSLIAFLSHKNELSINLCKIIGERGKKIDPPRRPNKIINKGARRATLVPYFLPVNRKGQLFGKK